MARITLDQFYAYITTSPETWLAPMEKGARQRLMAGESVETVYCWFYDLCVRCRERYLDHYEEADLKCPFAPTTYEAP